MRLFSIREICAAIGRGETVETQIHGATTSVWQDINGGLYGRLNDFANYQWRIKLQPAVRPTTTCSVGVDPAQHGTAGFYFTPRQQ